MKIPDLGSHTHFFQEKSMSRLRPFHFGQPKTTHQGLRKSICAIFLAFTFTQALFGQLAAENTGGGDWIDAPVYPSNASLASVGSIDKVPHINVNEFTGKIVVDLPTIGVGDLILKPFHKNTGLFDGADGSPSPINYSLGMGWAFHLGFIRTRRVSHLGAEKVAYITPQGERTEFYIDNLFQVDPNNPPAALIDPFCEFTTDLEACYQNYRDSHWIDENLNRITRQIWPSNSAMQSGNPDHLLPFGQGIYLLMQPDGTRTYFQFLQEETNDVRGTLVPYKIKHPDGRWVNITYRGAYRATPQIATISDEWGRVLEIEYNNNLPSRVTLTKNGDTRVLATFSYMTFQTPNGNQEQTLEKMITPEGRVYQIGYQQYGFPFPFVTSITVPSGGTTTIDYEKKDFQVIRPVRTPIAGGWCNPMDRYCSEQVSYTNKIFERLWVTRITYADTTRIYDFEQIPRDQISPTRPEDEYARLVATLKIEKNNHTVTFTEPRETYLRTSVYFAMPMNHHNGHHNPLFFSALAGRLENREETYTVEALAGFSGTETEILESQKSTAFTYYPDNGILGAPPSGAVAFNPRGAMVKEVSVTKDNQSVITYYEYDRKDFSEADTSDLPWIQLSPTYIKRWRPSNPGVYDEEWYTYRHEAKPVTNHRHDLIYDRRRNVYSLNLLTESKKTRFENGESHLVGRSQYDYSEPFYFRWEYAPPFLKESRIFRGPNDTLTTRYDYYILDQIPWSHSERFIVPAAVSKVHKIDNQELLQTTKYQNYLYNGATVIVPPLAAAKTTKTLDITGLPLTETTNGVTIFNEYDDDFRLTKRGDLQGEVAPSEHLYQSNGLSYQITIHGSSMRSVFNDPWGRPNETREIIDSDQTGQYTRTERTDYNAIGLADTTTHTTGAITQTEFDVFGRPVQVRTLGADLKKVRYAYKANTDGSSEITEIHTLENQSQGYVRFTKTDLFGRISETYELLTETPRADLPSTITNPHKVRQTYGYLTSGKLAGLAFQKTIPTGGVPRWSVIDWKGNLRREFHPEQSLDSGNYPTAEQSETSDNGITNYEYDSLNRLAKVVGPNSSFVHTFEYDDLNRMTARLDENGDVLESYTFDSTSHFQLLRHEKNGVVRSFSDFDGINRANVETLSVPEPLPAPTGLQPTTASHTNSLTFSWQGSGMEEAVLQFKSEGLPAVTFPQLPFGQSFTLTKTQFDARLIELRNFGALSHSEVQAYRDRYTGNSFFNSAFNHYWRVRGIADSGEPGFWSDWVTLEGNFPCDVTFNISQQGTKPRLEWTLDQCLPNLGIRILVSSQESQGSCTLDETIWLEFNSAINATRDANWMNSGYSVSADNRLQTTTTTCNPIDEALFTLEVFDNVSGTTLYRGQPLSGSAINANYTLHMETLNFGAQTQTTSKDLQVWMEGASPEAPVQVQFSLSGGNGAFSLVTQSLTFTNLAEQKVGITYIPNQTSGDNAILTASLPNGRSFTTTVQGRKATEVCDGELHITNAGMQYDFGQTIVGGGSAAKSWESRIWNATMNSCTTIERYTIEYNQQPGFVGSGITLDNAAFPRRLSGLQDWKPRFTFSPLQDGPVQATVTFYDQNENSVSIFLEGEGIHPGRFLISDSPNTPPNPVGQVHHGNLRIGAEGQIVLYVHNTGGVTQSFVAGIEGAGFSVSGSADPMAPGQSQTIWVNVRPETEGFQSGRLSIYPSDANTPVAQATITVNGTRDPAVAISPAGPTDLGELYVYAGGVSKSKRITNQSGAVLSRIDVKVYGDLAQATVSPTTLDSMSIGENEFFNLYIKDIPTLGPFTGEICYEAFNVAEEHIDTVCEQVYGKAISNIAEIDMVTDEFPAIPDVRGIYRGGTLVKLKAKYETTVRLTIEQDYQGPFSGGGSQTADYFSFSPDQFVPSLIVDMPTPVPAQVYRWMYPEIYYHGETGGSRHARIKVQVLSRRWFDVSQGNDIQYLDVTAHGIPAADLQIARGYGDFEFDNYTPGTSIRRFLSFDNGSPYPVVAKASIDYSQVQPYNLPLLTLDKDLPDKGFYMRTPTTIYFVIPPGENGYAAFHFNSDWPTYAEEITINPDKPDPVTPFPDLFQTIIETRPMGSNSTSHIFETDVCIVSPFKLGQLYCD